VAWVVDELSYVMDYGEGNAAEYVHWQFIRPALEHFCRDSGSELQLVPGNEVEAYCRGAWSLGEVDRVIRGKWKYKVIVDNKKEYRLVTKVVELLKPINNWNDWIGNERRIVTASAKRPSNLRRLSVSGESPRPPVDVTSNGDEQHSHDPESPATKQSKKDLKQLDGILAEGSEHSPHCSLVMGTPLSDQNRNGHVCTDHSATQVAKSNRVMETVIPSLDYRVQQAGGKVDQQAGGKVDESSGFLRRLQNARSTKSTIDSSPFRSCSASESLLPSPQSLSSLRPADEYLFKPPNNFSGNRRRIVVAKRLVNLRTLSMSCENPSSPVYVTSSGDEHSLDPGSSATKKSRKDLKQLDGTLAEDLEHSSMVMGIPLSDQNRNDHVCTDHSTTQVAKSNRVMETVIPSIDYRVQQAGGKVDQQAGGKVDESSGFQHRLQNASSSQSTIDSSPLRGCSASESLLPSPLADGKPLFVKSSAMWPQIEAMDVFSAHPQRPHFLPLREFSPTMREGMALGLMDVFPDLVRNIKKASIDNNMEWFEDKFSTLRHLEGHGFSVQSLHSTLTKLVKIKSQNTICLGEMDKLDVEIEVETASLTRMGALLDEKDSSIAELEQKLGALHQETQKIAAEMETKGTKLLRLKSKHSKFKEAYGAAKLEFHSVLAAL
jgi:hypothetical protein